MRELRWPVPWKWTILLALIYAAVCPFFLIGLFWLQGLPPLATSHPTEFLAWIWADTGFASFVAGGLLAFTTHRIVQRTGYFHQPYDAGRCVSLGAIGGAVFQAAGLWIHFLLLFHHAPTSYRTAGNCIAGCLTGGVVAGLFLWHLSLQKPPLKTIL